tara:strand:- start:5378 stop:5557 length:180 start_codon:yes stop_codon:yes gene_type:complete
MNYIVELREYTDSGDYIENDYEFDMKSEAKKFARDNKESLYEILEYKDGQNYNPKRITL